MDKKISVDIVVPVYNEGRNIEKTLDGIQKNITGLKGLFTVNIIFDFDQDDTLPVVRKISPKYSFPVKFIKNPERGVASAIKTGFKHAAGDYVLLTMADMSDDYSILPGMIEAAADGFDVICGSRYMKGGRIYGGPFLKKSLSRLAGISLEFITKIPTHDITNSYKMYKNEMLKGMEIESSGGFEISTEITAKAFINGCRITEIPCSWVDRTEGKSRFKLLKWLPRYLKWYVLVICKTATRKKAR